jgi:hypothetical protein
MDLQDKRSSGASDKSSPTTGRSRASDASSFFSDKDWLSMDGSFAAINKGFDIEKRVAEEKEEEVEGVEEKETYPEGGLQAWLVVLGSWMALFSSLGIMNTMATFQTYIVRNQLAQNDEASVGWIFSVYAFLCFFCGIYVGPIFDKYGPRWLILAGTICLVSSIMLMSICTGMPPIVVSLSFSLPHIIRSVFFFRPPDTSHSCFLMTHVCMC